MTDTGPEVDWWVRIGTMRWQHVVLAVAAIAGVVGLCFAAPMTCSVDISNPPTTATTVAR